MSKRLPIPWFIVAALLILGRMHVYAQADPPIVNVLYGHLGQIKVGDSLVVQDDKYFDNDVQKPYQTTSVITLERHDGYPIHATGVDTVWVETRYTRFNGTVDPQGGRLAVTFTAAGKYTDKATLVYEGAYRVVVKVVKISGDATGLRALRLVNELRTWPRYAFSFGAATVLHDSAWAAGTDRDELPVWWAPVKGADEYDLEWTYIDSASLAAGLYHHNGNPADTLVPARVFARNASRVSVMSTDYRIPLMYDGKGTLLYRVRAVQTRGATSRREASWTYSLATGQGRFDYNGHERQLNWQATTSFAEEGKRKTVVQYYDGSLRGRQTVTKDNTTQRTIVAESFYDYQGRPVVQALPAPTTKRVIGYTPNFNRGLGRNEYDKNLFDSLANPDLYCTLRAAPMDSVSGAAQYYSSLSPFRDSGIHRYVPHAGGFPFTEVEYTPDNTGRISRQSGVGETYRLGSGHETRYFYATPDQRELDALFGTEVGYAAHYFKNLVRDANGQYSISYVDMHGRTIATALAGNPGADSKLQTLASNQPATRRESLIDAANTTIMDGVMENKKALAVTTRGLHDFAYSLSPQSLVLAGCDAKLICYDCLYDLQITITGDCGFRYDTVIRNFALNAIDTVCNNGTGFNIQFNLFLEEGTYDITKTLSVSRFGQDYYRDSVYLATTQCKTLETFVAEQRTVLQQQTTDCTPSCASCRESLQSWPGFWVRFRQQNGIRDADTVLYKPMAMQAYEEAIANCDALCDEKDATVTMRQTLLMDMTPSSGQYAGLGVTNDRLSIFYSRIDSSGDNRIRDTLAWYTTVTNYTDGNGQPDLVFDESVGKLVPPQKLAPEVFAQRFKPSWATALLPKHPEFCKLNKYEQLTASHEWDKRFEATDSYADAYAAGFLNPTGETGTITTLFGANTGNIDPLYLRGGDFTALQSNLRNYRTIKARPNDNPGIVLSLWSVATYTVMCPGESNSAACLNQWRTNASAFHATTMCAADRDMAWRVFRSLYLELKRSYANKWINNACKDSSLTAMAILASGHQPHFTDAAELLSANDLPGMPKQPQDKAQAEAVQQQGFADNCQAYAAQWMADLKNCAQYDAHSINTVIIPALVEICKQGSDLQHPFGASSVKPSSTHTYRSFEAYLQYYNATHGVVDSLYQCNAYRIQAPLPYDQQSALGDKPLVAKPDSCECANITKLYNKYKPKQALFTSFAQYLQQVYNTAIADSTLTTLLGLCGEPGFPADDCHFLTTAIDLPPVFQCYTNDVCVDCDRFAQLDSMFRQQYPGVTPALSNAPITHAVQQRSNTLYEQYLNHHLGFGKTAEEYLVFKSQCNISNADCDSLQAIVAGFKVARQESHGLLTVYDAYDGEVFVGLPGLVQDGELRLPDSIRAVPIGWYSNMSLNTRGGKGFCWPNGYTVEVRMRYLDDSKLGDLFYTNFGIDITFGRYAGGLYLVKVSGLYELNDVPNPPIWVAPNASDWFTVKVKLTITHYYIYVNGNLVATYLRNSSAPLIALNKIGLGVFGRTAVFDYVKLYDHNDQPTYFEDYTDAANPALPDPGILCPGAVDCAADFLAYFNQRTGRAFTAGQVDSTYLAVCGKLPAACGDAPAVTQEPTLCGRAQPLFPTVWVDEIDNCFDSLNFIMHTAINLRDRYVDSLQGSFDQRYLSQCMQAYRYEQFTVSHAVSEYHYTLYYYDQAGNLVKTIAPAGVKPNYDSVWLDSVALMRRQGLAKTPKHEQPTQYRYNTLNQVTAQKSPDGGRTDFWYDRLGRLAISRNAKQRVMSGANSKYYSYTKYDFLGRITEVGQVKDTTPTIVADTFTRNTLALANWHTGLLGKREQVTSTIYDTAYNFYGLAPDNTVVQQNVRNRVSFVKYSELPGMSEAYDHASFYSYDIHGNVDTLVQDYGIKTVRPNLMNKNGNRWKKIVYEYDLISGKVNAVKYQPKFADQWTHRYFYDAENRLTEVQTSEDGITWEKEAKYEYYLHGPLARTTLGHEQVQGIDYAYTLQGWLKGINSAAADTTHDMGGDARSGLNKYVGRDALGFALNYYDGEYKPIKAGVTPFPGYRGANAAGTAMPDSAYRPLYNGNVSSALYNIRKFEENGQGPIFYNYRYDQLNRYVGQDKYFNFNTGTNAFNNWNLGAGFRERVSYDANGNIQRYLRYSLADLDYWAMDSLSYAYYPGTNQLQRVRDNVPKDRFGSQSYDKVYDIDDQDSVFNYKYDSIGNLIEDKAEKITSIQWNVYGKITEIRRNASITDQNTTFWTKYRYDAQGNRIAKEWLWYDQTSWDPHYQKNYTWYVRDAQGNLLSTYGGFTRDTSASLNLANVFVQQEDLQVYGSSRLGMFRPENPRNVDDTTGVGLLFPYYGTTHYRGIRQYELANHLGNVLTTVSDRKIGVYSGSSLIVDSVNNVSVPVYSLYEAEKLAAYDYFPFGMISRMNVNDGRYRFGFNGKENDNEVKGGVGSQQDYGMRVYDPRIGRFLSVDPLQTKYPWFTPYQFAGNSPIGNIDLDGLENYNYNLKHVKESDGTTCVTAIFDSKKDFNLIEFFEYPNKYNTSEIHNLYYEGKIIAQFTSFQDLQLVIHGRTPEEINQIGLEREGQAFDRIVAMQQYVKALRQPSGANYGRSPTETQELLKSASSQRSIASTKQTTTTGPTSKQAVAANNGKKGNVTFSSSLSIKLGGRTIIVDENLSPQIAARLQTLGYNVKTFNNGTLDADIISYADKTNAIVLTNNLKDFNKRGITTMKVSENMKAKSQINTVVSAIENVNNKAIQDPTIIAPGKNVSLAENKQ